MENKITVVIPTYNSMMLLKTTLDGFLKQTINKDCFELIIVDDGSRDGTKYLVDEYRPQLDISYYYLEDNGFRLAAARNVGIRYAKYDLILMFDCGMLPSPTLLESHCHFHQNNSDSALIGLSYGVEEFSMENAKSLSKILQDYNTEQVFAILKTRRKFYDCRYKTCEKIDFNLDKVRYPWVICWGGHISFPTSILRKINGFDEWFNSWGGEDVDLAIRLHNVGCKFVLLQKQEAVHIPHFRSEESNIESSQKNIKYIVDKNRNDGVSYLLDYGWEDILFENFAEVEIEAVG